MAAITSTDMAVHIVRLPGPRLPNVGFRPFIPGARKLSQEHLGVLKRETHASPSARPLIALSPVCLGLHRHIRFRPCFWPVVPLRPDPVQSVCPLLRGVRHTALATEDHKMPELKFLRRPARDITVLD